MVNGNGMMNWDTIEDLDYILFYSLTESGKNGDI